MRCGLNWQLEQLCTLQEHKTYVMAPRNYDLNPATHKQKLRKDVRNKTKHNKTKKEYRRCQGKSPVPCVTRTASIPRPENAIPGFSTEGGCHRGLHCIPTPGGATPKSDYHVLHGKARREILRFLYDRPPPPRRVITHMHTRAPLVVEKASQSTPDLFSKFALFTKQTARPVPCVSYPLLVTLFPSQDIGSHCHWRLPCITAGVGSPACVKQDIGSSNYHR